MAQTEQKNQNVKKQFEELQSLLERAMALQTSMVCLSGMMSAGAEGCSGAYRAGDRFTFGAVSGDSGVNAF